MSGSSKQIGWWIQWKFLWSHRIFILFFTNDIRNEFLHEFWSIFLWILNWKSMTSPSLFGYRKVLWTIPVCTASEFMTRIWIHINVHQNSVVPRNVQITQEHLKSPAVDEDCWSWCSMLSAWGFLFCFFSVSYFASSACTPGAVWIFIKPIGLVNFPSKGQCRVCTPPAHWAQSPLCSPAQRARPA